MKQSIARYIKQYNSWRYKWLATYGAIALLFVVSYTTIYNTIIDQSCYFIMTISDITLSLLLLLFMWGIVVDRSFARLSSRKRWLIWGIGMMVLILFFKFIGGYETRWF